jgi:hypothetical protein
MDKIPLQVGLLLFFISLVFFATNDLGIKDILMRSVIISVAVTILIQLCILILAKSINGRNPQPENSERSKTSSKEKPEGS